MGYQDEAKFRKWILDFVAGLRDHGVPERWLMEEVKQAMREHSFSEWREFFKSRNSR